MTPAAIHAEIATLEARRAADLRRIEELEQLLADRGDQYEKFPVVKRSGPSKSRALRFFRGNAMGRLRHGLWAMSDESDCKGEFYHGDRNETQGTKRRLSELVELGWEISADEAIAELENWPEAQQHLLRTIARYPGTVRKALTDLAGETCFTIPATLEAAQ